MPVKLSNLGTGFGFALLAAGLCPAQTADAGAWSVHGQTTLVEEWHYGFPSPYQGRESLQGGEEDKHTLSATLFVGRGLWKGAEIYVDPEVTQGNGLSGTQGIAGFPNGEATHASGNSPSYDTARLFFRQTIGLGGETEKIEDDENQIACTQDIDRVVLTAGKFAATDVFDDNAYSHDPRTQFLNTAIMDSGAWDFPADTKGYTDGFTAELNRKTWAAHFGSFMEPAEANGSVLDKHILKAWGQILQWDWRYSLGSRAGTLRSFFFLNRADMGSYAKATDGPAAVVSVAQTRTYRFKEGWGISWDQELAPNLGAFGRLSWNDGRTETWAFTEIDSSAAAGLSLKGAAWGRADDTLGLAEVVDGLSPQHRRYLAAGGYDFSIGDGRLDYSTEDITECYYAWQPVPWFSLSSDFQFVANPAYNRSRGPVSVFGIRAHCAF
jgi:high affinity Mn2+ porin